MTDTIIYHFIRSTPAITRILVSLTVLVSLSVYFDFVIPQHISYSRFYLSDFQFYRLFTSFFYYGKNSFELIMNFIFLYRYSSMLEESYTRKSDYFFTLCLIFICLIITSTFFYIPFLATPLSNTITYIWSRKNPQGIVQIFGFVSFSAFFLPFVFPLVSLIFEGSISKEEIVGIGIGQLIFYFRDVYPSIGENYFKTPCWVHYLFKESCDTCNLPSNANNRRAIRDLKPPATLQEALIEREIIEDLYVEDATDETDIFEDLGSEENEDISLIDENRALQFCPYEDDIESVVGSVDEVVKVEYELENDLDYALGNEFELVEFEDFEEPTVIANTPISSIDQEKQIDDHIDKSEAEDIGFECFDIPENSETVDERNETKNSISDERSIEEVFERIVGKAGKDRETSSQPNRKCESGDNEDFVEYSLSENEAEKLPMDVEYVSSQERCASYNDKDDSSVLDKEIIEEHNVLDKESIEGPNVSDNHPLIYSNDSDNEAVAGSVVSETELHKSLSSENLHRAESLVSDNENIDGFSVSENEEFIECSVSDDEKSVDRIISENNGSEECTVADNEVVSESNSADEPFVECSVSTNDDFEECTVSDNEVEDGSVAADEPFVECSVSTNDDFEECTVSDNEVEDGSIASDNSVVECSVSTNNDFEECTVSDNESIAEKAEQECGSMADAAVLYNNTSTEPVLPPTKSVTDHNMLAKQNIEGNIIGDYEHTGNEQNKNDQLPLIRQNQRKDAILIENKDMNRYNTVQQLDGNLDLDKANYIIDGEQDKVNANTKNSSIESSSEAEEIKDCHSSEVHSEGKEFGENELEDANVKLRSEIEDLQPPNCKTEINTALHSKDGYTHKNELSVSTEELFDQISGEEENSLQDNIENTNEDNSIDSFSDNCQTEFTSESEDNNSKNEYIEESNVKKSTIHSQENCATELASEKLEITEQTDSWESN